MGRHSIIDPWMSGLEKLSPRGCRSLRHAILPIIDCAWHEGVIVFLAQVPIDFVAAVRHLKAFLQPSALDDESLILKTILWEGFSGGALRPWMPKRGQ